MMEERIISAILRAALSLAQSVILFWIIAPKVRKRPDGTVLKVFETAMMTIFGSLPVVGSILFIFTTFVSIFTGWFSEKELRLRWTLVPTILIAVLAYFYGGFTF